MIIRAGRERIMLVLQRKVFDVFLRALRGVL